MSFLKKIESLSKRIGRFLTIKKVSYIALILNATTIILSIPYLLLKNYSILWDILGVILITTLFWNFLLIFQSGKRVDKSKPAGKRLNWACYFYLLFALISMIFIMLGNLLISVRYTMNLLSVYSVIYFFYFGLFVYGIIIALIDIKLIDRKELWTSPEINKKSRDNNANVHKSLLKRILLILSYLIFLLSLYYGLCIALGLYIDILVIPTILAGQFGIFFSVMFMANTLILLKLRGSRKRPERYYAIAFIGVISSTLLLVPLLSTPIANVIAESNFTEAFGSDWKEEIPSDMEEKYFLRTPFTTPQYFLGVEPEECEIEKDVKFYEDDELTLYFDAYMPKDDPKDLPGEGSMLIRLHGGGWSMLDKGTTNMLQMNKYFAAQGYIVFDVQYAQYDLGIPIPNTPDYLLGDYTLDEIVATLGYFTKYITNHSAEYDVNLDSVFISGGSAGGHLTCALALGIASGDYKDMFGTNLTIKGLIPFYPANGMAKWFGIEHEDKDLLNPERLVDKQSPPCLIYQGTHDLLSSWFHIAESIKNSYEDADNEECAIIWIPMGGHASDIYFNSYYNLMFLYYMERFIYLYH